jgi:2-amino-4-hydroxy-6-hydroxymethyldihydropteridine diphosphokinase
MKAGVALGSNLGDRAAHLVAARHHLASLHLGPDHALSSLLYETEPVDCDPGTASFLNAVVEIETLLAPAALLEKLRDFEKRQGRATGRARNSPREIDLDLLYWGDTQLQSPGLTMPHPRLTMRRFVLQPLSDIRPGLVLPGQSLTVAQLLHALPAAPAVRRAADSW